MKLTAFAVAGLVFAAGWAGGSRSVSKEARAGTAPPTEGATCTDRAAMEANANLVDQVHDYRTRLGRVERGHVSGLTEPKVAPAMPVSSTKLFPAADEWARMARDGIVRVRVPCASWDMSSTTELRTLATGSGRVAGRARMGRSFGALAETAGLSESEGDALKEAYARVVQQTWAKVQKACESRPSFTEAMTGVEDPDDGVRLGACQHDLAPSHDPAAAATLRRVAELHAASAGVDRATSDEQRILFAITSTPKMLYEEMIHSLGHDKTLRVIDYGLTCFNETVYDARDVEPPPPEEEDSEG
jgi:hypothetical protein